MKRIVSLLLTLCLLGVLSVSAASNSPALTYRTSGDNVELTLEGVAQSSASGHLGAGRQLS